jgi:hypothetical protein
VLTTGLDRLRRLFAGSLALEVFNLEPEIAKALEAQLEPAEHRARVVELVNPEEDLRTSAAAADQVSPARQRPLRARRVTRYPLVFCHGMLAFSTIKMQLPENLNSFIPLAQSLRDRGFRVFFPRSPRPAASSSARSSSATKSLAGQTARSTSSRTAWGAWTRAT